MGTARPDLAQRGGNVSDHLGIFGRDEGETGDVDVDQLRAALAATPPDPPAPGAEPEPEPIVNDIDAQLENFRAPQFGLIGE